MLFRAKKFTNENGEMFFTGLKDGDIAETVLMPETLLEAKSFQSVLNRRILSKVSVLTTLTLE